MNHLPETLEQLAARVEALEQRVRELELASPAGVRPAELPAASAAFGPASDLPSGEQISGAFLLLGKSMLGIAGAYLLRALAESNLLPRLLIAAVAIAYAIAWLVAASRASAKTRFAPALFACTSALILAPMLWELTMRFHVLTGTASAGVLGIFVGAATALTGRKNDAPDLSVAYTAAAITALALAVVTHETMGFLVLLLAMLALCEYQFTLQGKQAVWMLVAAVTDSAVWILIVIYHTPANTRTDYPAMGAVALAVPASLMFLITAGGMVFRTAALRGRITVFETAQSVIAFLLWVLTCLYLVPHFSTRLVGVVCLLFAGACYGAAYAIFRHAQELRNFNVFALWSAALLLTGVFLLLPPPWAIACLALASVVSAALAVRVCCTTLECHGIVYLGGAALACGLLEYSFRALAGTMPETVAWSVFLVCGCAIVSYALGREAYGEPWQLQLLHLIPALLAVSALAALTAQGALWLLARGITPAASHVAFIRTLIMCAMALGLALAGSHWRRLELRRLAYVGLALIAAKLVYEDLRHGHMGFIAGSIFLFALTLIGVPRLARASERA
jgi:hypothetical protein